MYMHVVVQVHAHGHACVSEYDCMYVPNGMPTGLLQLIEDPAKNEKMKEMMQLGR